MIYRSGILKRVQRKATLVFPTSEGDKSMEPLLNRTDSCGVAISVPPQSVSTQNLLVGPDLEAGSLQRSSSYDEVILDEDGA